jgi:hypothetical protein
MSAAIESSSEPRVLKLTGRIPIRPPEIPRNRHDGTGTRRPDSTNPVAGSRLFALTVPRQHGAWASLLAAFLLGTAAAGQLGAAGGLLLVAMLAAFFGRQSGLLALKLPASDPRRSGLVAWTTLYMTLFFAVGLPLVLVWDLTGLVPIGAAAFALLGLTMLLELRRQAFSMRAELAGFAGLSLAAPAAELAASGAVSARTAAVGLMAAAFFIGSLLHVRHVLRRRPGAHGILGWLKAGAPSLIFHFHILGFATAAAGAGYLPLAAPLAFSPAVVKVVWVTLRSPGAPVRVRALGWHEAAHTLLFVGLVAWAYHGPA